VKKTADMRWFDYVALNAYWFALTTRAQVLTPLVIPLLVQQFVGEAAKGAYVGRIRLWALMVAVLVQAAMGLLSDRCTSRWGRRRPFILVGALSELALFAGIGLTANMRGMAGYAVLMALYVLSMISSNTAHAATQGLIPDLVPEDRRGRASGVKAFLELPLPLVFVSFIVAKQVGAGNLWGALMTLGVVTVLGAAAAMGVREKPLNDAPPPLDWKPLTRLLAMTAAFTLIILGAGALTQWALHASQSLGDDAARLLTGVVGLIGMLLAVALGVWASVRISIGPAVRDRPAFVWWVVNRLAFLIPTTNLSSFMVFFVQARFPELAGAQAAGPAATAMMFVGVCILLTALPSGWLADRISVRTLIAIACGVAAAGTAVLVCVPSLAALNAAGALIGAAVGLFYASNWTLGTRLVPAGQAGRYLGLSNLAGAGAGAIGAYIGGPIADQLGYVFLFAIYGLMFLLSALPLLLIREP